MSVVRRAVVAATVLATVVGGAVVATATDTTACSLGGPTPGARVLRLDLPHGASDVSLALRSSTPTGRRLAEGIFLLTARSHRIVAFRIAVNGVAPAAAVVRADHRTLVGNQYDGPAMPFARTAGTPVPGLAPGTYYVVGFGIGSARTQWNADIAVTGAHSCTVVGRGRTRHLEVSGWSSDTTVTTPVASSIHGSSLRWDPSAPLVVGIMQATHELAGHCELGYRTPSARGTVRDTIAPFVSRRGRFHFTARGDAAFPMVAVEAALINLPAVPAR